ncbi:helix-turn-helix transcriptional regulator [Thermoactinomyces sp. DSM 45892]|uniref:ArsR/SmtB family transcription factor n=1 Tax=Thermoactinomyces sp. DSM 45892 TaxID=1882753 RepID=UPI00089A44C9|nr:metalloregulator ArsR/SmtB family transcription factor [Thermoactinomyces sp. DSM 45892]SDZ23859.1 transcriptional regulator, ArsR family [Thermoactinomyces sp. DSM 45892]
MTQDSIDVKVKFIRGFADKTRLQILDCIKKHEKTVSQIVVETNGNQSNVSQHLACLKGCGIITSRQEGKFMYYRLRDNQIHELLDMFDHVLSHVHEEVTSCKRNDQCFG